jgi:phosphotransferase system enzyme I (PtsP)
MLDVLRRITQEVNTATGLDEALAIMVRRVREAMAVDACSIFLVDETDGSYVLMATDGLRQTAVGQVRLGPHEGLVGWVGERREVVSLENASQHPRYCHFPETGEERFQAFIGVPVIHYRRVLGVLTAQQWATRLFSEDEVDLLFTIAAQLGGVISAGLRSGSIGKFKGGRKQRNIILEGIVGAPGVAVGTVVLPSPMANLESVPDRKASDIEVEEAVFRAAVAALEKELRENSARLERVLPMDAQQIFEFYSLLLSDEGIINDTVARIRAGNWAAGALRDTIMEQARIFERMEDNYLQVRAEDIRGIGRRLLMYLQGQEWKPKSYPKQCILVGEEISAARIADVPVSQLAGIVCTRGSVVSHTAILARALGIPAIMGLGALSIGNLEGGEMVVDGYQGRVIIQPSRAVRTEFQRLVKSARKLSVELEALRYLPAETPDGLRIALYANTGLLSDIAPSLESGAEGVGLYRTEFAFMVRESFPSEEEQYQIYRTFLESFAPRPVTLRTLDIGGDKSLSYFPVEEENTFMGWRGIRLMLDHPEIFLIQLRAMLRANAGLDNLRILLPMISRYKEVDEARALVECAHRDLLEENQPVAIPPLGVMLEVPAALYQIETLARRADFFSIGTNDLTQYLLAVDRSNARVSGLYDSLHPAVLNAIHEAVQRSHHCARPISVCGEIAGDPLAVILLLGMGVDALSMAAPSIPRVKWVIRAFIQSRAREILKQVLGMEDPLEIRQLLNNALEEVGLGALVQTVK